MVFCLRGIVPMAFLHILAFLSGLTLVLGTLRSAVRTFVVPRSINDRVTRTIFQVSRWLFGLRLRFAHTYAARDGVMAFYAPVTLLCLPLVWVAVVSVGYTLMYWALGVASWQSGFTVSGSSLLTLGFATLNGFPTTLLTFSEATIGLLLVALLIAYLPTMYAAFSKREMAVTLLEVRAGSPPSAVELLSRYHRIGNVAQLRELWVGWESWFAELDETHTSLAALSFFRSPDPSHSWVTASGAVLDAASLYLSCLEVPLAPEPALCLRAGFIALRRIADFFTIRYDRQPSPTDPISVRRDEFDVAWERLSAEGLPLKEDREAAWLAFSGWRVNYDTVLLGLATLTMAPEAPWSSDRARLAWGKEA